MYTLKKFLALSILLLASPLAWAGDAALSWTNATLNTDATVIPASGPTALKQTEVQYGICDAAGLFPAVPGGSALALFPATTFTFTGLANGAYCFRARHQTNEGTNSAFSATVKKTIAPVKTKAPTGLTVV